MQRKPIAAVEGIDMHFLLEQMERSTLAPLQPLLALCLVEKWKGDPCVIVSLANPFPLFSFPSSMLFTQQIFPA